jgi:hypothetical protein
MPAMVTLPTGIQILALTKKEFRTFANFVANRGFFRGFSVAHHVPIVLAVGGRVGLDISAWRKSAIDCRLDMLAGKSGFTVLSQDAVKALELELVNLVTSFSKPDLRSDQEALQLLIRIKETTWSSTHTKQVIASVVVATIDALYKERRHPDVNALLWHPGKLSGLADWAKSLDLGDTEIQGLIASCCQLEVHASLCEEAYDLGNGY